MVRTVYCHFCFHVTVFGIRVIILIPVYRTGTLFKFSLCYLTRHANWSAVGAQTAIITDKSLFSHNRSQERIVTLNIEAVIEAVGKVPNDAVPDFPKGGSGLGAIRILGYLELPV